MDAIPYPLPAHHTAAPSPHFFSFTSLLSVSVMAACHYVGAVTITSGVESIPTSVEGTFST